MECMDEYTLMPEFGSWSLRNCKDDLRGMFSAPNDYFIASRKFIKDEISIQESLVK